MKFFLAFSIQFSIFGLIWLETSVSLNLSRIWGPGLTPDKIIMPARYFFVHLMDHNNNSIEYSVSKSITAMIEGGTKTKKPCRIWTNVLDRKDSSYIIRYKLYETCSYLKISVIYEGQHVAESPYIIDNPVYPDDCVCPKENVDKLIRQWDCGTYPSLIKQKLNMFGEIDWRKQRNGVRRQNAIRVGYPPLNWKSFNEFTWHQFNERKATVVKNIYFQKCYGKHVGFNMFVDNILLSLTRKVLLPDIEFFANLGDWPLSTHDLKEKYPILSWCGSTESYDIIMPTYDITESALENMGRVTLDILSVQGNTKSPYKSRIPKLFWRGRDSNKYRLELIKLSRKHSDLFNASLTNFFFYRDEEEIYGPKAELVSFFSFFDYKYQLAIDGTVAPYRMPYLLGGGSVVFKPESKYFEHFYKMLEPNIHYIPVKTDISDLTDKIKWAIDNDEQASEIARNGQKFANNHLMPKDIFCYHFHLFNELSKSIISPVDILDDMENIEQSKVQECDCSTLYKDEL